jgi:hypothetical protein
MTHKQLFKKAAPKCSFSKSRTKMQLFKKPRQNAAFQKAAPK